MGASSLEVFLLPAESVRVDPLGYLLQAIAAWSHSVIHVDGARLRPYLCRLDNLYFAHWPFICQEAISL